MSVSEHGKTYEKDRVDAGPAPNIQDCLNASSTVQEHLITVPFEPTMEQWNGLARHLIFAFELNFLTPKEIRKFLQDTGCKIPSWLEVEFKPSGENATLSKGTRAVLVYKAMLDPECWHSNYRDLP